MDLPGLFGKRWYAGECEAEDCQEYEVELEDVFEAHVGPEVVGNDVFVVMPEWDWFVENREQYSSRLIAGFFVNVLRTL